MREIVRFFVILLIVLCSAVGFGQEPPSETVESLDTVADPPVIDTTSVNEAELKFQAALASQEAGDHKAALSNLEQAYRLNPHPIYIYHRVLVLESMDEPKFALQLLTDHRDTLLQTDGADDVFVIEERLKLTVANKDEAQPIPLSDTRSSLHTVGPIALGVAGLALAGWSVYIWTASCDVEDANGDCLQGESANVGIGGVVTAGALGAIAGAIIWWIAGAPDDVSVGLVPNAGGLTVRF